MTDEAPGRRTKDDERDAIARATAEFMARGYAPTLVPNGVSGQVVHALSAIVISARQLDDPITHARIGASVAKARRRGFKAANMNRTQR